MDKSAVQLIQYDSVETTMSLAIDAAEKGAHDFYCVQAYEQTSGKGRHGNQWISPQGNLYLSIVLRPKKNFQAFGQMAFVVALALKDMLIETGVSESLIKIKWPNDLLVAGQKISGLLLEAGQDKKYEHFLILGTGVNIFAAPQERTKIADHVDLSSEGDLRAFIDHYRDIFLGQLENRYQLWHDYDFSVIRDEWLASAAKLNEQITVRTSTESYSGIFRSIDEDGALLLEQKSGINHKVQSGEVFF